MKIKCKEPYEQCEFRGLASGDVFRFRASGCARCLLMLKTIEVACAPGCSKPAYNCVYLATGCPEYIPDESSVYIVEGRFVEGDADV